MPFERDITSRYVTGRHEVPEREKRAEKARTEMVRSGRRLDIRARRSVSWRAFSRLLERARLPRRRAGKGPGIAPEAGPSTAGLQESFVFMPQPIFLNY